MVGATQADKNFATKKNVFFRLSRPIHLVGETARANVILSGLIFTAPCRPYQTVCLFE